jgi:hypothetical protein
LLVVVVAAAAVVVQKPDATELTAVTAKQI